MPSWKKVIISGSDAALNSLNVTNGATISSSLNLTGSFNITGSIQTPNWINFRTGTDQPQAEGRLGWDDGYGTLNLGLKGGNVNLAIGQEQVARVYNADSVPLTDGMLVYISGSQGNRVAVKRASAAAELGSASTLGMVTEPIAVGAEGFITTQGVVNGLNTTGLTAGALLYLSSSAGQYTMTRPTAPTHTVVIGYVERVHATVGSIFVKIDNGYELGELHDVLDNTSDTSYGDLLVKSGSIWTTSRQLTGSYSLTGSLQATSFTGSLSGNATTATSASFASTASFVPNGITGTGTTNYLPKFTGTTTQGNSLLFDNGTGIGQNTTSITSLYTTQGTSATNAPTLGSELLSSTGWTTTGWTGDFATGFTNGAGNTSVLSNTLAAVVNVAYLVVLTVTGRTAGSFTTTFGGQTSQAITGTTNYGVFATTTGSLQITPTSDFNGTIVVSVKQITVNTLPFSDQKNSSGTLVNEIRINDSQYFGANSGRFTAISNTFNVAFGNGTLSRNITGNSNSAFGVSALQNNTSGINNIAIGLNSLRNNITGLRNIGIGVSALFNNISGNDNAGVGNGVLSSNTTGGGNVALGTSALAANTTANANTAIGVSALQANTTGFSNTAVGRSAGLATTVGSNNTFLGMNSGYNNTTGAGNVAIGQGALQSNIVGSTNSAVGQNALLNSIGSNNTALGAAAGRFIANGSTANITSSNSVFIGADSRANADNETNQIVIGQGAIGGGSNTVTIGNTSITSTTLRGDIILTGSRKIWATNSSAYYILVQSGANTTDIGGFNGVRFFTGTGTQVMSISSSGSLLLGTTTDNGSDRLQVSGNGLFTGTLEVDTVNNGVGDFLTRTAGGIITRRTASEVRTDIGAQATLVSGTNIKTINGNSLLGSGDITIGGSSQWYNSGSAIYYDSGSVNIGYLSSHSPKLKVYSYDTQSLIELISQVSPSINNTLRVNHIPTSGFIFSTNDTHTLTITPTGNVGIGSVFSNEKLYVEGNTVISGTLEIDTVNNGAGDFLTRTAGGIITRRTASEVRSDIGAQAALTNPITGTGTANTLPKFTGSTTLGNSNISDNGSLITLNSNVSTNGNLIISQSLLQYSNLVSVTSGSTSNVALISTGSYTAAFFDYVATSGTNSRAGTVFTVWNGNNIEFSETSTNDIGNTSNLILSASLTSGNIRLQATSLSGSWGVKTLVRMI